jgi:hypothetical protein
LILIQIDNPTPEGLVVHEKPQADGSSLTGEVGKLDFPIQESPLMISSRGTGRKYERVALSLDSANDYEQGHLRDYFVSAGGSERGAAL